MDALRAAAQSLPSTATGQQWISTWSDEFNTGTTDLSGWTYDLGGGGWGNQEKETYTNSSQNVSVSGGALHITAIATGTGSLQTYTSGRIRTTNLFSQTYGLMEFRAKFPAGTGLWPAMWMMPKDSAYGGWPTSGEVDVFESKGQSPSLVQGSLHSGSSPNTQVTQTRVFSQTGLQPAGFSTGDWHTYDLQWIPGSPNHAATMKWWVDGINYYTQTGGWFVPGTAGAGNLAAPFDKPFYILLNLAVGGTYVGNPSLAPGSYDMQVDYVRSYQSVFPGDANVDGKVDTLDFNALASNFGGSGKSWRSGDFNGDGVVDTLDFNSLAANFGKQSVPDASGAALSLVPEPAGIGLLTGLSFAITRSARRRRRT